MSEPRSVEEVVGVVVPRLQDAVAVEVRKLAQELASRADEVRAEVEAEHAAALAREHRRSMAERAEAISAAVSVAREQAALGVVSRLVDAIRRLDEQTNFGGVLDALADLAAAEAGRAALFVAAEGALKSWRTVGFDAPVDEPERVLAVADAGVVARAIDERRSVPVTRSAEDASPDAPPAFAALSEDCAGVAVPVLVGGEAVVAVYADEGTGGRGSDRARWTRVVELYARHAGARLEALTAERAAAFARDAIRAAPAADPETTGSWP